MSLHITTPSRPGRRGKHDTQSGTGKKPKKVNSEIRKQQNRIASRNYREKRKRKLQYLQQLLRDGSEQATSASGTNVEQETRSRSPSAEQQTQRPILSPRPYPANDQLNTLSADTRNHKESFPTTTTAFDSNLFATSPPFTSVQPTWTAPYFSSPPQMSTWHFPQWLPSVEFCHIPGTSSSDNEISNLPAHQMFDHVLFPHEQSHEVDNNLFILGSYGHVRRHTGDLPQISSLVTAQARNNFIPKRSIFI
ncbi:hypothetical protein K491DRAFT_715422 [Lophiostoma macrostomum CBS 122681]|uniref:BZIP domain-containing protein n=1 Tax=Lophiostoma macrostomum CBS 122681 TaxID=1314788 RepID=A0A6A6T8M6_9PLEO|nr:hypothetical protein K491DRAFT_715422 [Lophiostoma macrostomum CBS 122681]